MLIKRVYEIDPLTYSECGDQMKVVAFVERPQGDVIERILGHCGLWCPASPRATPAEDGCVRDPDGFRRAAGTGVPDASWGRLLVPKLTPFWLHCHRGCPIA